MKYIGRLYCIIALPFVLTNCNADAKDKKNKTIKKTQGTNTMSRTKTNSGLEYTILQVGTGESPKTGNQVTVHYTGWLDNKGELGSKFDSSVDRNRPFTFVIGRGQVIKGWDEGVATMKIGEKRRLFIPANLAYGAYSPSRGIPPHSNLIFDVELLSLS